MTKDINEMLSSLPPAAKTPCVECPWLRTALPGHLGPWDATEWVDVAHGEGPVACHMTVKYDDQPWEEVRQCVGLAIFRANICKKPRHPNVAIAKEQNTALVFGWDNEFIAHHEGES